MIKKDTITKKEKEMLALEHEIVDELVELRKSQQMTQKTVAESAGVIRETIARIETKVVSPQFSTIIKMADALGYDVKIVKREKSN